ncbi:MAG TPA: hypothetical protein VEV44_12920 [Pseudoneobacillus sp.]|nr:hypothetical protein [Pseudoneobacillus sp.]
MSKRTNTSEHNLGKQDVEQPLMSTGTTEPGFEWEKDNKKATSEPKIGETLIEEAGILGVFDK